MRYSFDPADMSANATAAAVGFTRADQATAVVGVSTAADEAAAQLVVEGFADPTFVECLRAYLSQVVIEELGVAGVAGVAVRTVVEDLPPPPGAGVDVRTVVEDLPPPPGVGVVVGHRFVVAMSADGVTARTFADMIFMRQGRILSMVVLSAPEAPIDDAVRQPLLSGLDQRLAQLQATG